jgi:hypothetical protein
MKPVSKRSQSQGTLKKPSVISNPTTDAKAEKSEAKRYGAEKTQYQAVKRWVIVFPPRMIAIAWRILIPPFKFNAVEDNKCKIKNKDNEIQVSNCASD